MNFRFRGGRWTDGLGSSAFLALDIVNGENSMSFKQALRIRLIERTETLDTFATESEVLILTINFRSKSDRVLLSLGLDLGFSEHILDVRHLDAGFFFQGKGRVMRKEEVMRLPIRLDSFVLPSRETLLKYISIKKNSYIGGGQPNVGVSAPQNTLRVPIRKIRAVGPAPTP